MILLYNILASSLNRCAWRAIGRRLQCCSLSEQLRTSVAVSKLTSIYWSLSILRGSYADILPRARFSLRATRLLVFILTPSAFSSFQSWKVLIPHLIFQLKARGSSTWSEIWSSFKNVASLLRRYAGFHRTLPDRVVTWKGFVLLRQEKITLMKD